MFGSGIFEAAIGTVVIYLLLSLVCLVLNEWISRVGRMRANILRDELMKLLGKELATELASEPLISGTFESKGYPSYIASSTFALALIQLGFDYTPGVNGQPGTTAVKDKWEKSSRLLLEGLRLAAPSLGPLQARIEKWFDLAMEQASGRFKRGANSWVLAISGLIVVAAHVDSIAIASKLYDGALTHQPTRFPLFWSDFVTPWYIQTAGLALTWAAVSLGAPFWFDILNKLVNIRQTGLPPDENKRQTATPGFVAH